MIVLKIKDIIKITNGELITGNEENEVLNYTRDSRNIPEERNVFSFQRRKI